MAAVDPYSPCPCGSGQKYKWCCHKMEAYAERAQRLFDSGQFDAAIEAIDEGLQKDPANAWLLTRKAVYQIRRGEPELAKDSLRRVLKKQPKHVGALSLLTRLVADTEGAIAGAAQLQQLLTTVPAESRDRFALVVRAVGGSLLEEGHAPAALKHLEWVRDLSPEGSALVSAVLRSVERSPSVSPWLKNSYALSPAPDALSPSVAEQYRQALQWAQDGLWSSAGSAFEVLSAERGMGPEADRNLGLCRLWVGEDAEAVSALRRAIGRMGATPEAVDLEALCQEIEPERPDDLVEHVQLTWPLRDRSALLDALRADNTIHEGEPQPVDPEDPDSPRLDHFELLHRALVPYRSDLQLDELARIVGRILVGQDSVALETYDDGRLDNLIDRFTTLAGHAIPPAHPRTKVIGKASRSTLTLSLDWAIPEGMESEVWNRLSREQRRRLLLEVWPETPMPYLAGRTPRQAAQAGGFDVPLRAALFLLQITDDPLSEESELSELRASLRLEPEPAVDPANVDVEKLHLARLALLPIDFLGDEQLVAVYRRARAMGLSEVVQRCAQTLVKRPDVWERVDIPPFSAYSDLAAFSASVGNKDEALDWIRRGRQADPVARRAANAPDWDMLELRLRARLEHPELWVPDLAVLMERYSEDQAAHQTILVNLMDMGLVQMTPSPDRPGDFLVDTRALQALIAEYGPRITTASGQLGVSAAKGALWTPGASSEGPGGGLWTPGSGSPAAPAGPDKPRLIIPGR